METNWTKTNILYLLVGFVLMMLWQDEHRIQRAVAI
jgi:hypothetical protein